ncbi:MAG TPA: hypothetical protein DCL44_07025 [Elusimicrobia bacterium]|nr:hypothetical protein [Elusimicrobiota bacterium]
MFFPAQKLSNTRHYALVCGMVNLTFYFYLSIIWAYLRKRMGAMKRIIIYFLLVMPPCSVFAEVTLKLSRSPNGKENVETFYKDGRELAKRVYNESGNISSQTGAIPDGAVKLYEKGKLRTVLIYKNGKANGMAKEYYPAGKIKAEQNWLDDKLDGSYRAYNEDGKINTEAYFKNGKRNGIAKLYYPNGTLLSEINYKDGKMEGTYKDYSKKGVIQSEKVYTNGMLNGPLKIYYPNGKVKFEVNYRNNEREGKATFYHKNGKIKMESNFKADKENGITQMYYDDGRLEGEGEYKNGILGEVHLYYKDGRLKPKKP